MIPLHEKLDTNQLYITVDLLILTVKEEHLNILLSKRTQSPYAHLWALPGRFVEINESAETTAKRLMDELFPLKDVYMEQLYTFTEVNRDPRGRVISVTYLVIVPFVQLKQLLMEEGTICHCFEIQLTEDFQLIGEDGTKLIGSDLAFDHSRIIETGIARLQGKIDYTEIGFRFLNNPMCFSLGELQSIYEAILGKPEDGSNFRRFIRKRYEETRRILPLDREERKRRGRPAVLYRLT